MKKIKFTLFLLFCLLLNATAQNTSLKSDKKIRDGAIFLKLDGNNKLTYFTDFEKKIDKPFKSMTFSLVDDNSCNIYAFWMNPLKYKLSWDDSTYIDPRDLIINDFLKQLVAQFPISEGVNSWGNKGIQKNIEGNDSCQIKSVLYVPQKLSDINLNFLIAQLVHNYSAPYSKNDSNDIVQVINPFIYELEALDIEYTKKQDTLVNKIFKNLYDIEWNENIGVNVKGQEKEKDDIIKNLKQIDTLQIKIKGKLKDFKLSGNRNYVEKIFKYYTDLFLYNTEVKNERDKDIANKLDPIFKLFDNSLKNIYQGDHYKIEGYYNIKTIEFENGKVAESELSLEEYKLKENDGDISIVKKKTDLLNEKFIFQKYDPFDVWVSTGVLYTNITEKEFGVSNEASGKFLVTEEDIKKQRTGAAFYLNLKYDFGSRYFAPLIQIGIDPTHKKPFFLLGGGFMLGSNFAITGGPIWTWNATLSSLKVGEPVNSTTDLEKDIKYEFDSKPKGWYLGIQYNF